MSDETTRPRHEVAEERLNYWGAYLSDWADNNGYGRDAQDVPLDRYMTLYEISGDDVYPAFAHSIPS